MNFDNYPQVKNDCNNYFRLLGNVVVSENKCEFYENVDMFKNFKEYIRGSFENTYKSIRNHEEAVTFLDSISRFYTSVHNENKSYTKWVKDRYKFNKAPTYLIVDFLTDLSDDVHDKAMSMKDKKFNVMLKVKNNEVFNKGIEKDIKIEIRNKEIQDLRDSNITLDKEKELVLAKLSEQIELVKCYERSAIEHKLTLLDGKLVKLTKVKPRRTLGLDNAIKVRELHEKGYPIESLAVTFNVEVNTIDRAIKKETYV